MYNPRETQSVCWALATALQVECGVLYMYKLYTRIIPVFLYTCMGTIVYVCHCMWKGEVTREAVWGPVRGSGDS